MAYREQEQILEDNIVDTSPHFYINGYNFNVSVNAEAESELNIVKNKMYVAGKRWGYTDMQWTNFTGEKITCEIYSRATDEYTGDMKQPDNGGIDNFFNTKRTPHAVLKYWAQTFTKCYIQTNIQSFESGLYIIDSISQSSPHHNFIVTKLTFQQYERTNDVSQTYWTPANLKNSTKISAQYRTIERMVFHKQGCKCTDETPGEECSATSDKEVKQIQTFLQQWGYFPSYSGTTGKITANGKFCWYTTQALRKFQQARGIEVTGNFDQMTKANFMKKLSTI